MNSEKSAVQNELRTSHRKDLERREIEKRTTQKSNRTRLVVAFHVSRIKGKYDGIMTDSVRNCE